MNYSINSETAHELVKKAIARIIAHGYKNEVYGGTIPKDLDDKNSPNDYKHTMIEHEPLILTLNNPIARWCNISNHYCGITLRETEDTIQQYNTGHVTDYSKVYRRFLNKDGYLDYTYGERFRCYPYNPYELSGKYYYKQKGRDNHHKIQKLVPIDQFRKAYERLQKNPSSRRACISTWYPSIDCNNEYVPCNMVFQMRIINGKLNWITVIRSLDVLRGLTENIFMFTIWQNLASYILEVPLGEYTTMVMNPHLYLEMKNHFSVDEKDPYTKYEPKTFESPFPKYPFQEIDTILFCKIQNDYTIDKMLKHTDMLDEYWKNWKLALIGDYLRLTNKPLLAQRVAEMITNEFQYPVMSRIKI